MIRNDCATLDIQLVRHQFTYRGHLVSALWLLFTIPNYLLSDQAPGLTYRHHSIGDQSIHILTIDPLHYQVTLVPGLNEVLGRESVASIAGRYGAVAAINGGFFEIGGTCDGEPSGALKMAGQWHSLSKKNRAPRAVLGWSEHSRFFDRISCQASLRQSDRLLMIDTINTCVSKSDKDKVVLYTSLFHSHTLTGPDRIELLCRQKEKGGKDRIIEKIHNKGSNLIPSDTVIISLPRVIFNQHKDWLQLGNTIEIIVEVQPQLGYTESQDWTHVDNLLGGIPLLVADGLVLSNFKEEQVIDSFLQKKHARTAVGVTKSGHWIWVVLDHHKYKRPLDINTMFKLMEQAGYTQRQLDQLTFSEIKSIIKQLTATSIRGMTMKELAVLMKNLGAIWAINLDGGGSSTLYYQYKVINEPQGDEDENLGQFKVRRVANALLAVPKSSSLND